MPFRPAYASYILPLAIILAAVSLRGLWVRTAGIHQYKKIIRALILIVVAIFSVQIVRAAIDYKQMKRKSDWRGINAFISEKYDTRHFLIFDSFSHFGSWEPTYYGFPRYYRGKLPADYMQRIPYHALEMAALTHEPVLVLFQWREYNLTPRSLYPILPVPNADMRLINYERICQDPQLDCTEFTGFSLIRLKEKCNNLALETYRIIERLLMHLPDGSWKVELHLAAAALARAVNLDRGQYHQMQAEDLTHRNQLQRVKDTIAFIQQLPEVDLK